MTRLRVFIEDDGFARRRLVFHDRFRAVDFDRPTESLPIVRRSDPEHVPDLFDAVDLVHVGVLPVPLDALLRAEAYQGLLALDVEFGGAFGEAQLAF